MDRDGSNRLSIFPPEGSPGVEAQQVVWAPLVQGGTANTLAIVYEGNLWLVDATGENVNQVTGDGLIKNVDWK